MPPSTATISIVRAISRSTAAVSTGKLLTPERTNTPAGLCTLVESRHAEDEIGGVREVDVVDSGSNAGLDHAIAMLAVVLEGARGIDDKVRALSAKAFGDIPSILITLIVQPSVAGDFIKGILRTGSGRMRVGSLL